MNSKKNLRFWGFGGLLVLSSAVGLAGQGNTPSASIAPASMPRIGTVDERFQSYNIEAVEVTGGRFWKPLSSSTQAAPTPAADSSQATPVGLSPSLYEYRPPIDLSNARLRKLAAALGPAYLRVSGTWMNTAFFQDSDDPAPSAPPKGFGSVLTRREWKGVVDFSKAVDARLVTSFATSAGTRDAAGVWTPEQAEKILAYTKSIGGSIAAAEYMNEPNFAEIGGAPKGYSAQAFARDFSVFKAVVKARAPGVIILGPGGVMEGSAPPPKNLASIRSEDILAATGPAFDAFSYHSYGSVSSRCAVAGLASGTTSAAALSAEWLARADQIEAYYAAIRDRLLPGKPIWITETAQTACGGDAWASKFLDSFRYLDQLGSMAKRGVQVHMHNTLAASDYGLLDEKTYEPRPNYWAALLWRKLMGNVILDPGPSPAPNLHLYAQCLRGKPGGVALLAINADRTAQQTLTIPSAAERYTLTARDLLDSEVQLNGTALRLGAGDALPQLSGKSAPAGQVTFEPASITFLAFSNARNASCR